MNISVTEYLYPTLDVDTGKHPGLVNRVVLGEK